jgi:hypothetical protein
MTQRPVLRSFLNPRDLGSNMAGVLTVLSDAVGGRSLRSLLRDACTASPSVHFLTIPPASSAVSQSVLLHQDATKSSTDPLHPVILCRENNEASKDWLWCQVNCRTHSVIYCSSIALLHLYPRPVFLCLRSMLSKNTRFDRHVYHSPRVCTEYSTVSSMLWYRCRGPGVTPMRYSVQVDIYSDDLL